MRVLGEAVIPAGAGFLLLWFHFNQRIRLEEVVFLEMKRVSVHTKFSFGGSPWEVSRLKDPASNQKDHSDREDH